MIPIRLALALAAVLALLAGGWWVRDVVADRAALRAERAQNAAAIKQLQDNAVSAKRQQEVNDAESIRLQERAADLARIRDGLGADLARSLRSAAAGARARVPAVSAAAGAVPHAPARAGLQPAPARAAAVDPDADAWERFNGAVERLARHADEASAAADTAAAERNALARLWQQHADDDAARRAR